MRCGDALPQSLADLVISIPAGAIEILATTSTTDTPKAFQYQQVRLRWRSYTWTVRIPIISIPAGAIEMDRFQAGEIDLFIFQYQQVRLRSSWARGRRTITRRFQYQQVRLRFVLHLDDFITLHHFNTSRCD